MTMDDSLGVVQRLRCTRDTQRPQNVVITGCTSGIGLYACKIIKLASPNCRIFLVARNGEKASHAAEEVRSVLKSGSNDNIFPMVCDHACLASVRSFCSELKEKLTELAKETASNETKGIDVLCLNAAVLLGENSGVVTTSDNIELTFQTNHLAPFLIGSLLADVINPGGRVVITTSGLQQYASFNEFKGLVDRSTESVNDAPITVDGSEFDSKQAYSVSKLCNVAFTLALNRRLQARNSIAVCFTPGLIPNSGLFRYRSTWAKTLVNKEALGIDDTEEWGGCFLAWMALSDEAGKKGGLYWRTPLGISKRGGVLPECASPDRVNDEARDIENQETLWRISSELTRPKINQKATL